MIFVVNKSRKFKSCLASPLSQTFLASLGIGRKRCKTFYLATNKKYMYSGHFLFILNSLSTRKFSNFKCIDSSEFLV